MTVPRRNPDHRRGAAAVAAPVGPLQDRALGRRHGARRRVRRHGRRGRCGSAVPAGRPGSRTCWASCPSPSAPACTPSGSTTRQGLPLPADTLLERTRTDWFPEFLSHGLMAPHFQPIVELTDGRAYGREALMRGRLGATEVRGAELVAAAEAHDALFSFDARARAAALEVGLPLHAGRRDPLRQPRPARGDRRRGLAAHDVADRRAHGCRAGTPRARAHQPRALPRPGPARRPRRRPPRARRDRRARRPLGRRRVAALPRGAAARRRQDRPHPHRRASSTPPARRRLVARSSSAPTSRAAGWWRRASSATASSRSMRDLGVDLGQGFYFGQPTAAAAGRRAARPAALTAPSEAGFQDSRRPTLGRRAKPGIPLAYRSRSCPTATCSPTSSACAGRWTSCSATSSTAGCLPRRRGGLLARRRRLLHGRPAAGRRPRRPRGRSSRPSSSSRSADASSSSPAGARPARTRGASTSSSRSSTVRSGASSPLGADVDADAAKAVYEDGMLIVELPVLEPATARTRAHRAGPAGSRAAVSIEIESVATTGAGARSAWARPRFPEKLPRAAAARHRHVPRHAHAAGRRPGALDPPDQRRAGRRPHDRDGRQPRPRAGVARPRRPLRRRRRRRRRADAQGPRRHAADPRPGRPARAPDRDLRRRRALPRGARARRRPTRSRRGPELTALMRNVQQTFSSIIEQVPYLPEELQMAVANVDDPSALSHLIAGSLRIKTEEKQELLEELDVARRLRRLSEILARELEVVGDRLAHPVPGPVRDRPAPARVRPAPAAQGDPGGAGRARPHRGGGRRAARAARRDRPARGGPQAGRPRALAARAPAAGGRRARRDPHLPRVDRLAAVGHARPRTTSTSRTRARCSTPTTTTSSASRTASSSSSPCASSSRDARGSILLLRRPARRRQDVARALDRRRARAQVRAHQRRRRARRGRDPRPPPHLHRRDAGRRSSARCATRARTTRCS